MHMHSLYAAAADVSQLRSVELYRSHMRNSARQPDILRQLLLTAALEYRYKIGH
jgi:hypothetical protein